ncbi:MAG: helix-turn-helix domain-containing protein [Solirubrobacteraceae bacterium]
MIRELAQVLPQLLDDDAIQMLALRLGPHLPAVTSSEPVVVSDVLLTAAEAADHARVNVETVRRAIRAGNLAVAAQIGRSPRVTRRAVEEWLAGTAQTRAVPLPRAASSRRARSYGAGLRGSLTAAFREP